MLKSHARQIGLFLVFTDLLLAAAVVLGLVGLGQVDGIGTTPLRLLALGFAASLIWPPILEQLGLYGSQRRRDLATVLLRLGTAAAVGTTAIALMAWALSWPVAPQVALQVGLAQAALLGGIRLVAWGALRLVRRAGRNYRTVLVIGSGPRARQVSDEIDAHPEWGLRILAFLDDGDVPVDPAIPTERVHKFQELPEILAEHVVDEALLACPRSLLPSLAPTVALLAEVGLPVTLLSDLFGDLVPPPRITRFGSMTALSFAPVHHGRVQLLAKRLVDVVGAAGFLAVSAPLLGACALLIKLTSPGPVFFRQIRCGLRGRPFEMLKLRSMYVDAEARRRELASYNEMDGPVFKIQRDPRVTPVGRWLRRFSIDEIPQFWNVLRGDMSLVGPRPPLPEEVAQYRHRDRRRLSMRPGLTCLWQVSGRNRIGFQDWVDLDLSYIDQWSLATDAQILMKTPGAVMRGDGAS